MYKLQILYLRRMADSLESLRNVCVWCIALLTLMVGSLTYGQEDLSFLLGEDIEGETIQTEGEEIDEKVEEKATISSVSTKLRLPEAFYQGVLQRRAEQRLAVAEAQRDAKRAELETSQLEIDILSAKQEEKRILQSGANFGAQTQVQLTQIRQEPEPAYDDYGLEESTVEKNPVDSYIPPQVPLHTLRLLAWRPDSHRPNAMVTSTQAPDIKQIITQNGQYLNINIDVSATSVVATFGEESVILNP